MRAKLEPMHRKGRDSTGDNRTASYYARQKIYGVLQTPISQVILEGGLQDSSRGSYLQGGPLRNVGVYRAMRRTYIICKCLEPLVGEKLSLKRNFDSWNGKSDPGNLPRSLDEITERLGKTELVVAGHANLARSWAQ